MKPEMSPGEEETPLLFQPDTPEPESANGNLITENPFGLISNEEFCRIMGISKKTSGRWRSRGLLPFVSIQKQVYYKVEEVRKLLDQYSYRNSPRKRRK